MFPSVRSNKPTANIERYVGTTSATTGTGFVIIKPVFSNDMINVIYSGTSAFALETVCTTGGEAGVTHGNPSTGFASASFGVGELECRCVSMGVRVAFSGLADQEGGEIYAVSEDNGNSLLGFGVTDFTGENGYYQGPWRGSLATAGGGGGAGAPGRQEMNWYQASWQPSRDSDFSYNVTGAPVGAEFSSGILIKGAGLGQRFLIEVATHWELVGDLAPPGTKSHADSAKTEKVISALDNMPPAARAKASNGGPDMMTAMMNIVAPELSIVPNFLGGMLASGMSDLWGGAGLMVEDLTGPGVVSTAMPIIEEIGELAVEYSGFAPLLALML